MEKTPNIISLRSTIFLPNGIGYSADNERKYHELLPNGQVKSVLPNTLRLEVGPGVVFSPGVNDSWQLVDTEQGYNIVFIQNKIDLIYVKINPAKDVEKDFIAFTIKAFKTIIDEEGPVVRMAYSPTYVLDSDEGFAYPDYWKKILLTNKVEGMDMQDINVQYLLKKDWENDGNSVSVNLLHNWSDAIKTQNKKEVQIQSKCITLNLDINTVPSGKSNFKANDMERFFNEMPNWANELLNNY